MGMMTVRIFPYVFMIITYVQSHRLQQAIYSTVTSSAGPRRELSPQMPVVSTLCELAHWATFLSNGGWLFASGERGDAAARAGA